MSCVMMPLEAFGPRAIALSDVQSTTQNLILQLQPTLLDDISDLRARRHNLRRDPVVDGVFSSLMTGHDHVAR